MDYAAVTASELRGADLPASRGGLDPAAVRALLERAASTIEGLTRQVGELHETIAVLRAESATMDVGPARDVPAEEAIAAWLASIDPVELERHVEATIAEAIVEATVAARQIRAEAVDRSRRFADALAVEADALGQLVEAARGSAAAMNQLGADLDAWRGRFDAALRGGLAQLQLPWGTRVSEVARLLARLGDDVAPDLAAGAGREWRPPGGEQRLADTPLWGDPA